MMNAPFFFILLVNRIESGYDRNNPNSGKVMIKCAMKYEGQKRQADWNNQGICNYRRRLFKKAKQKYFSLPNCL